MVPVSVTLSCAVTLFVSMILPVLVLLFYAVKNKKAGILSAWLLGAAGFLVPQICIRLPILSALTSQAWFLDFSRNHLFLYAFSLAFTAGLFELAGRFAAAKLIAKNLTWKRSLAAGLGHGGIEAIFIVGMTYVNNLTYILMINSGTFDAMLTQIPADQAAYLESIRLSLTTTSPGLFLLAGFERILTMIAHAAMSVMVCRGVAAGRPGKAALLCLGLHTLIDLTAGISLLIGTTLSQTGGYTIIYILLTIAAVLSLGILGRIRRDWIIESPERSVPHAETV